METFGDPLAESPAAKDPLLSVHMVVHRRQIVVDNGR